MILLYTTVMHDINYCLFKPSWLRWRLKLYKRTLAVANNHLAKFG